MSLELKRFAHDVFEQVVADARVALSKYCVDDISVIECRERIRMLGNILSRLDYEGQDAEILAMVKSYQQTMVALENKLVTIDLKKRKFLHELEQEA